jgi:hypothetical protein
MPRLQLAAAGTGFRRRERAFIPEVTPAARTVSRKVADQLQSQYGIAYTAKV